MFLRVAKSLSTFVSSNALRGFYDLHINHARRKFIQNCSLAANKRFSKAIKISGEPNGIKRFKKKYN